MTSINIFAAQPTTELITKFISASEKARQKNATQQDIDHFLAFLSDDMTDHHIPYNVSFTGKQHLRDGFKRKAKTMISVKERIEDIVLGTSTAVVVVNEDSKYYKRDKLKHYLGRTILVLEFNEQGLISSMRRYIDM